LLRNGNGGGTVLECKAVRANNNSEAIAGELAHKVAIGGARHSADERATKEMDHCPWLSANRNSCEWRRVLLAPLSHFAPLELL
jgi:hypothetical protein